MSLYIYSRTDSKTLPERTLESGLPQWYTLSSGAEAAVRSSADLMHLQWFAAEEEGRTEDPTERKIRKAKEDGKVAKSSELVQAVVLLFCFMLLAFLGRFLMDNIIEMVSWFLKNSTELDMATTAIAAPVFLGYFIKIAFPFFIVSVLSAVIGNVVQIGFIFSLKPIEPDLKKIMPTPSNFMKKLPFSPEGGYNLARTIFKVAVIVVISWLNIKSSLPRLTNTINMTLTQASLLVLSIGFRITMESIIFFLALSIPDYMFQRWQHRESLKMTRHEVKEEYKESEGDPQVKAKLKQMMRDMLQSNMVQNVKDATVVITNPTHFAIALEYKFGEMTAPRVTAKGMDNMAQRIKQIAGESGVPMVENRPLARALHANVEIGDAVPEEYWQIVAEVLKSIESVRMEAGA